MATTAHPRAQASRFRRHRHRRQPARSPPGPPPTAQPAPAAVRPSRPGPPPLLFPSFRPQPESGSVTRTPPCAGATAGRPAPRRQSSAALLPGSVSGLSIFATNRHPCTPTVIPAPQPSPPHPNRHSGASRNLKALLDSGFRRSDGQPAQPPKTKRYRHSRTPTVIPAQAGI